MILGPIILIVSIHKLKTISDKKLKREEKKAKKEQKLKLKKERKLKEKKEKKLKEKKEKKTRVTKKQKMEFASKLDESATFQAEATNKVVIVANDDDSAKSKTNGNENDFHFLCTFCKFFQHATFA